MPGPQKKPFKKKPSGKTTAPAPKAKKSTTKKAVVKKAAKKKSALKKAAKKGVFELAASPNFKYILTVDGVSVSLLNINDTLVEDIKAEDKIFAEEDSSFFVQIMASLDEPDGSGTFQLVLLRNGKKVFDEPKEFEFENSGNGGLFLEDIEIPS
jgi:hypothetical protein